MLGGEQRPRRRLDEVGIRRGAQDRHWHIVERACEFRLEDLVGNFQQDRAALAAAHGVKGAAHQVRELLHVVRHGGPLGDTAVDFRGPEGRPDILPLGRKSGRDDQHRHILGIGLRHARKRVLDAGPVLGRKHAVLPAAPNARIAIRHADADAFLPAQDRPDVELGTGFDQRIARIAGEERGSLALENFRDDIGTIHLFGSQFGCFKFGAPWLEGPSSWLRLAHAGPGARPLR